MPTKHIFIPAYKVHVDSIGYIYDELVKYKYYISPDYFIKSNEFLRKNQTAYIVLNYKNKFGYVDVVDSRGVKKDACNRRPINNLQAFLSIANQLKNGGKKYFVKKDACFGDLKDLEVKIVQSLINKQYSQRGFTCIEMFQHYNEYDNDNFGVTFVDTVEGYNFWKKFYLNKTAMCNKSNTENNIQNKKFTKQDLKPNMIFECRNKMNFLTVSAGDGKELFAISGNYDWLTLSTFNDNLTDNIDQDFDIVKVYKFKNTFTGSNLYNLTDKTNLVLVWERPKVIKMTKTEIARRLNIDPEYLCICEESEKE